MMHARSEFEREACAFVRQHPDAFAPSPAVPLTGVRIVARAGRLLSSGERPSCGIDALFHEPGRPPAVCRLWAKQTADAAQAYEETRRVWNRMRGAGVPLFLPEPLALDDAHHIVFTRRVRGRRLTVMMLEALTVGSPSLHALRTTLTAAGAWLAHFHSALATTETLAFTDFIADVKAATSESPHFSVDERTVLLVHADAALALAADLPPMPITRTHNDFTPRNILVEAPGAFVVTDWDAMVHPRFPARGPGWVDATIFFLNTLSLARYTPFVSRSTARALGALFLDGYTSATPLRAETRDALLWAFALFAYLGMLGDRPLYAIYRGFWSARFSRRLRARLLQGPRDFCMENG